MRDHYKYHFKQGATIVHRGITNNLLRREGEHKRTYGSGNIVQIGNAVTKDSALEWERNGGTR